ncbi:tRNA pseudouridine(55) synthase TruB [Oceanobacter mangrovi]|uniref:tRNA pseudouridine(55) synthase TruB n=1 Tax=Oceanobacter mangrovi TaxID=2862510 RepID=UPI001C8EE339|nr:tRNA pseudouridine(55) synthase TruB [Oceanobacter mangrovi]
MAKRKKGRDVHGIVLLNKPLGVSSNHALQTVKRLFNANKAGHTGALDPEASGLLPICLGEATKFSQLLLESDKSYQTRAYLGEVRSTGDSEGEVIRTAEVPALSDSQLADIINRFIGDVEQVPPMFSALKLDGKPLYELARKGMSEAEAKAIAEKKRRVIKIHSLTLDARPSDHELDLTVHCSKGTYIRTLVEDIGDAIGCGAYVAKLHRIQTGPYQGTDMLTLEQLAELAEQGFETLDQVLLPIESAVPGWPKVEICVEEAKRILNGQSLRTSLEDAASVQLWAADSARQQLLGVGQVSDGVLKPVRLLNIPLQLAD